MKISVVINTKNSASTLKQCLQSVKWADEIIVVDMHSLDDTVEIAKKYTDKVYSFKDVGFVEPARNFAIGKASGEWILVVDADEEITSALKSEILTIIEHTDISCFALPRKNIVLGDWLQTAGWWPDYQLRLFKRGAVAWQDTIHSIPKVEGKIRRLPASDSFAILHHNYQSVEDFIERLNRYTSKEVEARKLSDIRPSTLIGGFRTELMSRLFYQNGISGGNRGVGVSFLQATYELTVRLKQWQAQGFEEKTENMNQTLAEVQALHQDLAYWIADLKVKQSSGIGKIIWIIRRKMKI